MGLILLVEDEPGAVALMRRYMENSSMEHKLAVFEKAAEALFYAVKNKVDLFILDIQLWITGEPNWQGSCVPCRNIGLRQFFLPRNWQERSYLPTGKSNATISW